MHQVLCKEKRFRIVSLMAVLALGLTLVVASGCDSVDAAQAAPEDASLRVAKADATASSTAFSRPLLDARWSALEDQARLVGLTLDTKAGLADLKGDLKAIAAPVVGDGGTSNDTALFFAGIQSASAVGKDAFYTVRARRARTSVELHVYDVNGKRVRNTRVATVVARLLSPCLRLPDGGTGDVFDDVCKAQGGTTEEECEDCFFGLFTCCEKICSVG